MNKNLKKILIKTKKEAFSEVIGNNSSKLKGEGYDFCELKEYEYGDDAKNIDWIASAKMQKPFVKVFYKQKELNIKIVNLLGGSVYFGTARLKQELICEIASLLAFICVKQSDSFSSYIANESLELCTKKSKKMLNVQMMSEKIYNYSVLNKSIDYPIVLNELFKNIFHKSMVFLIGDFFYIENLDLRLLAKKHELIVIIVRDRFEEEPKELGNVSFQDPSFGISYEGIFSKQSIKAYKEKLEENDHKLYKHLQSCAIRFTKIYTDENPVKKLIGLLK